MINVYVSYPSDINALILNGNLTPKTATAVWQKVKIAYVFIGVHT